MKKGIILVTKHFPFNKGETPAESYLENEIKILAANAEKVFVIAAEAENGASVTCSMPENVEYAALQSGGSKKVKACCVAKAAAMLAFKKPVEISDEIKNRNLGFKSKLFLCYFAKRALQKLACVDSLVSEGRLRFSDYDTIYSFWLFDNAYMALTAKHKYGLDNYTIVSRTHRYDLYEYSNKLNYIPLRPYLLENLDGVFPCSDNGTQYLAQKYPKYKNKVKTSFLGSRDYGIQPYKRIRSRLHIASCSRLIGVKRVNRIAECLSKLEGKGIELEWTHFGGGALFDELKQFAEKSLHNTVFHLKGNTENAEVMRRYSKMSIDVFVNVSENEGLPISIMEATSFGMPVIATDVGGTNEIVREGINGFLLEKDFSDDDFIRKLIMISEMSDDEYMKLRKNSRNIYEENFECVRNVERFLAEIGR